MNRGELVDVIADARIAGAGREMLPDDGPSDVHLAGGRIVDIAPAGALPRRGAVLDAQGGWLVPGLWDHHVHAVQWALAAERVSLADATGAAQAASMVATAPARADGRRIGVGYRDGLWPDAPDRALLDDVTGEVPTYLVNADLHSVWLNSAALRREGHEPHASGVLREEAAFEIERRLNDLDDDHVDAAIRRAARGAASRGVVGFVDFDVTWNADPWRRRFAAGFDTLRVDFGVYPEHLDRAVAEGLHTGESHGTELLKVGPFKVITDGSLGTRTALCTHPYRGEHGNRGAMNVSPAELIDLMTRATGAGFSCAVHAIGDVANRHALDAFALTGATGTVEHAQLLAHADVPRFARLGVAASVQPEHAMDDRELIETLWAGQTSAPYPFRSLRDAGVNLRFGSDAPVAALDPWAGIASAVFRTRGDGEPWRAEEAIDARTALAAATRGGSTGGARIEPGGNGDVAVVDRDPLSATESQLRQTRAMATLIAGRLTHIGG